MEDQAVVWGEEGGWRRSTGECIIQGDAFSPLLFALMIDPLIDMIKTRLGDRVEVLCYMNDLTASTDNVETTRTIHSIVKRYAASVGMVINTKKSAIQLNVKTPLPESLQEIPRLDETTYNTRALK